MGHPSYYGKIHSKLPNFRVKSEKIYTGQKQFTRIYSWGSWQIWGMLINGHFRIINEWIQGKYQCKMEVAHMDDCTFVSKASLSSFDNECLTRFFMLNVNILQDNLINVAMIWKMNYLSSCSTWHVYQVTPKCSPVPPYKCPQGVPVRITTASGCTVSTKMMMRKNILYTTHPLNDWITTGDRQVQEHWDEAVHEPAEHQWFWWVVHFTKTLSSGTLYHLNHIKICSTLKNGLIRHQCVRWVVNKNK